jgi:hypothetical protein
MRAQIESRSRETAVCLRERERKVEAHEENRGRLRLLKTKKWSPWKISLFLESDGRCGASTQHG